VGLVYGSILAFANHGRWRDGIDETIVEKVTGHVPFKAQAGGVGDLEVALRTLMGGGIKRRRSGSVC